MAHAWNRPIRHLFAWLTLWGILGVALPLSAADRDLRRTPIVKAYQEAKDSIVNLHGRKTVRAEQPGAGGENFKQVNGMGTGIVIDSRGYILTNYHVVEGVANIQATFADKRNTTARLISHDPHTDLAVIKVDAPNALPVIKLGTSSDLLTGEPVIAVGNAYGYEHTITDGIISSLHRPVQVSDDQQYSDLIQTNAEINPGNSGGPLMNIYGEVIGINVAVRVGAQGIGFAIPIDEALEIAARLVSADRLGHASHGIAGKCEYEAQADGSLTPKFVVTAVRKDTIADKAGVKSGDRITHISGRTIARPLDLEFAFLGKRSGEDVAVEIVRAGSTQQLALAVENVQRTSTKPNLQDRAWEALGVKVEPIPRDDFAALNSHYRGGLKITAVRNDGPAHDQGIRKGDVLVGMHVWQTVSLDNFAYILDRDDLSTTEPLLFYILREGDTLFGHIRLAKKGE